MRALAFLAACSAAAPRLPSRGVPPVGWVMPQPALLCVNSTRLVWMPEGWACR